MASTETERDQLVTSFKLKFRELQSRQTKSVRALSEYDLISLLMDKSTHFISHQVIYENIHDRLDPIFTAFDLQQAEAKASGVGSIDAMCYVCSSAKRLMFDDFISFLKALAVDHFHAAKELEKVLEELLITTRQSVQESSGFSTTSPHSHTFPGVRLQHGERQPNHTTISHMAAGCHSTISSVASQSRAHSLPVSDNLRGSQRNRGTNSVTRSGFQEMLSPLSPPANHSTMMRSSNGTFSIPRMSMASQHSSFTGYSAQPATTNTRGQSEVYDMSTMPRGYGLIINNENFDNWTKRQGSSIDVNKLYNMFKYLGFEVRTETDKTGKEMKTILRKFSQHRSLANVSSIAIAVLTHGGSNDCLFGKDGQINNGVPVAETFITKMDIIEIFKGSACRAMEGKPKLFILQACRGEAENLVAGREGTNSSPCSLSSPQSIGSLQQDTSPGHAAHTPSGSAFISSRSGAGAETSDMCFVYSSSYGYKAYRTTQRGSPFIAVFSEQVRQLARQEEFREIIRKIQNQFNQGPLANNKMTLPDFSVQLINKWFLSPPRWANLV